MSTLIHQQPPLPPAAVKGEKLAQVAEVMALRVMVLEELATAARHQQLAEATAVAAADAVRQVLQTAAAKWHAEQPSAEVSVLQRASGTPLLTNLQRGVEQAKIQREGPSWHRRPRVSELARSTLWSRLHRLMGRLVQSPALMWERALTQKS